MNKYSAFTTLCVILAQIQCSAVRKMTGLEFIKAGIDTLRADVVEIRTALGIADGHPVKNMIADMNEVDMIERGQILEREIPSISQKLKLLKSFRSMKQELENRINAGMGNIEDYRYLAITRNECHKYCRSIETDILSGCSLAKIIYFELNVRVLSDDNRKVIRSQIADTLWKLHRTGHRVYMLGYSCDLGNDKYDYLLSADRAENTRRYILDVLSNRQVIDEADILTIPRGKAIPNLDTETISVGEREEIRKEHRKVEIFIPRRSPRQERYSP